MVPKGREKAETKETNIFRICLASSKQGVNAVVVLTQVSGAELVVVKEGIQETFTL